MTVSSSTAQQSHGTVTTLFPEKADTDAPSPVDNTPSQIFIGKFLDLFGKRVKQEADANNWTKETRILAVLYIKQLTQASDASVILPEDLKNKNVIEAVQQHFTDSCVHLRTRPGTFAGQSEKWFKQSKKKPVRKPRTSRTASNCVTPAVMRDCKSVSQAS